LFMLFSPVQAISSAYQIVALLRWEVNVQVPYISFAIRAH
jgi:hypothetical protein